MARLWEVMTEAYGNRWTATFHDKPNKTWTRKCIELNDDQMGRGVEKSIDLKDGWPPSIGQFRELALGSFVDHGMLEPPAAYRAAVAGKWSERGVYHAVEMLGGTYTFRRMEAERSRKRFERSYQDTLQHARKGWRLRYPTDQAPTDTPLVTHDQGHQGRPSQASIQTAKQTMAEIRKTLGMKK